MGQVSSTVMPELLVVIPTVKGREESLKRCLAAYRATSPPDTVYCVAHDLPTCGQAWDEAMRSSPEAAQFVHFSADDLEPRPGWYDAAVETVKQDAVPAPYVYNGSSGSLEMGGLWGQACLDMTPVPMTTIPFFRWAWWYQDEWSIPHLHYFSDNLFSSHVLGSGRRILTRPAFAFDHYWEQPGRIAMNGDQWNQDRAIWAEVHASYGLA